MKSLFAFGLAVVVGAALAAPASAQYGGRSNALGGGGGARASNHPLGGFTPGRGGPGWYGGGFRGYDQHDRGKHYPGYGNGYGYPGYGFAGYPYAYSFFVPDYSDSSNSGYGSAPDGGNYGPAPNGDTQPPQAAASQQPIIINQYFGTQSPQQDTAPQANSQADANAPQNPGDPLGAPQNYYLIAFKTHEVSAAIAYWVEDKTLHYVTTQNTHNQASLDLVDLPLTKSLNQNRDIPFSLPGQ